MFVERERDWLLTKLREAKGKFNELQAIRAQKGNGSLEEGMSLLSNDSSYTLDFGHHPQAIKPQSGGTKEESGNKWKARLENDYGVTRDHAMVGALSHMIVSTDNGDNRSLSTMGHLTQHTRGLPGQTRGPVQKSLKSKRTLGKLVAARAKQEAIGDFIGQCANSCRKGTFAALAKLKPR